MMSARAIRRLGLGCLLLLGAALPLAAASKSGTQTKQLLDKLIPYAHSALEKTGTFVPFGGGLSPDGQVHFMQADAPKGKRLDAADVRGLLVDSMAGVVQSKGFVAAAVISDTHVRSPKSNQLVRAIRADLRFRGNKTETLFVPYSQDANGKLSFQPSFKQSGELR